MFDPDLSKILTECWLTLNLDGNRVFKKACFSRITLQGCILRPNGGRQTIQGTTLRLGRVGLLLYFYTLYFILCTLYYTLYHTLYLLCTLLLYFVPTLYLSILKYKVHPMYPRPKFLRRFRFEPRNRARSSFMTRN